MFDADQFTNITVVHYVKSIQIHESDIWASAQGQ